MVERLCRSVKSHLPLLRGEFSIQMDSWSQLKKTDVGDSLHSSDCWECVKISSDLHTTFGPAHRAKGGVEVGGVTPSPPQSPHNPSSLTHTHTHTHSHTHTFTCLYILLHAFHCALGRPCECVEWTLLIPLHTVMPPCSIFSSFAECSPRHPQHTCYVTLAATVVPAVAAPVLLLLRPEQCGDPTTPGDNGLPSAPCCLPQHLSSGSQSARRPVGVQLLGPAHGISVRARRHCAVGRQQLQSRCPQGSLFLV